MSQPPTKWSAIFSPQPHGNGKRFRSALDALGAAFGHAVEVDRASVGVAVGPNEDVRFDDANAVGEDAVLAVFLPALDEVAVVALDDAGVVVDHAPCGTQLLVDELERTGVLVDEAGVREHVKNADEGSVRLAAELEGGEGHVCDLAGNLVDDDATSLVVDALPGGVGLGPVANDDAGGLVVDRPLVELGALGERDDGCVGFRPEDELACVG